MKSITIHAFRRPQYLRRVLESLRKNDLLDQFELFFGLEPGCEETIAIAKSVDWIKTHVHINSSLLGVRNNPYQLMSRAFDAGSIMNVYLEEDVVVAPDILRMANWYLTTQDETKWLSLNLLNYNSSPSDALGLIPSKQFNALGLVIRVHAWRTWFKNYWLDDSVVKRVYGEHPHRAGWDWSMNAVLEEQNLRTLTPVLSRSNHIGREDGVHASPEFHDRTFGNLVVAGKLHEGNYYIVGETDASS